MASIVMASAVYNPAPVALTEFGGSLSDHPSLQDRVYRCLREAILDGRFASDARLIETRVAQALGVSRNPVREAIRRLQQEGLVVVRPRTGVYVASFSIKDIEDTYTVRGTLEGLASALAARSITPDELDGLRATIELLREGIAADDGPRIRAGIDRFHDLVHAASRNDRLIDLLVRLNDSIKRFRSITSSLPERRTAALRDHEEILAALDERDGTRAEWLMRSHIDGSRRRLLAHLAETSAARGAETGSDEQSENGKHSRDRTTKEDGRRKPRTRRS